MLRSGQVSDVYFDKYMLESDPELLRAVAEHSAPLVPGGTEILAGLESEECRCPLRSPL